MSNIEMTKRHQRAINEAIAQAFLVQDMIHRLGSVIVSGGKIVSKGHNSLRSKLGKNLVCSVHAEIQSLQYLFKGTEYQWMTERLDRTQTSKAHNDVKAGYYVQ